MELGPDNFGTEFIFDLLLADTLLAWNPRLTIRLQVKPHPCYVSDVIAADVPQALHWLKIDAPASDTASRRAIGTGRTNWSVAGGDTFLLGFAEPSLGGTARPMERTGKVGVYDQQG